MIYKLGTVIWGCTCYFFILVQDYYLHRVVYVNYFCLNTSNLLVGTSTHKLIVSVSWVKQNHLNTSENANAGSRIFQQIIYHPGSPIRELIED